MLRSPAIRLLMALIVCLAMPVAFAQAQTFGNMSPVSTGEAVAILVGAGAAIGIVVYLVIPKQKTIAGCVETADNGLRMTDVKDRKVYRLESETSTIKPGQQLKVKGKKRKDKSGIPRLRVRKIVSDFGPCTQSPIS